jgi:hypothetical protein
MTTPKATASKLFRVLKKIHAEIVELKEEGLQEMLAELNEAFDDKSEKWQDSEKGAKFREDIDTIEYFEEILGQIESACIEGAEQLQSCDIEADLYA